MPEVQPTSASAVGASELLAGTLRAFVALELSREVRTVLAGLIDRLSRLEASRLARVRWTPPDNLHLTLKFLGRVEATQLPALRQLLAEVAAKTGPLRLALEGAGAFPAGRHPQVLWVGIADPQGEVARLAAAIDERLLPLGFPAENRAFSPHLTLGRVGIPARARPLVTELVEVAGALEEQSLDKDLTLFRSETLPGGARYTALFRVPLARGGAGAS